MGKRTAAAQTLRERLTVLETDWPHLEKTIEQMSSEIRAFRKQVQSLQRYLKAAVTLGAATVIQLSGAEYADSIAGAVKIFLGFLS